MKRLALIAVLVAGCGATVSVGSPGAAGTPTPKPVVVTLPPDSSVAPTDTPDPTDTPEPVTAEYKPGDVITITTNGDPWAEIVISKVKVVAKYDGPYNLDDVPAKGNVYIQAFVTYTALDNGVDYNPFDWQVFVGGEAADNTYVSNGPTPTLDSGTLPKGRKASGWVVHEVAAKGEVRMSYGGTFSNEAPVFEVIIRAK